MLKDKKIIIQILVTKYDLSLQKVEGIINSQFNFVEKIVKKGDFESIRLPYFGKFSVNSSRVKYITELKKKKQRDDQE